MTQPFFPCTMSAQSRNNEFLTIKTVVRKTHQKGESLHCALLLDYVPPEEPPSTPLGNALRIR